jgi:hypothetical protein
MYIVLRCESCDRATPVAYSTLYGVWSEGLCDKHKRSNRKRVTATLRCPCGNHQLYDSPMYRYVFGLVFKEYSAKEMK